MRQRRFSAEFDTQRPRTGAATARVHRNSTGISRPAAALVSPRHRTREKDSSPLANLQDNGLAAAARLAAAVTSIKNGGSAMQVATECSSQVLRPRRQSAFAGTTSPTIRQACRLTGGSSPRLSLGEARNLQQTAEQQAPAQTCAAAAPRVAPGDITLSLATSSTAQAPPPAPTPPSESLAPMLPLRPRLQRTQSVMRPQRDEVSPRARSADPRRRRDSLNAQEEIEEQQDEGPQPELVRMTTSPALVVAAAAADHTPGMKTRRRASTGNMPTASAAATAQASRSHSSSTQSAPFKSLPSKLFSGTYAPTKVLGRGASATVWEAIRSDSEQRVAIKVFDQGPRDKMQAGREMKVLSRIKHRNVIEAFEVVELPRCSKLICELVDGDSLRVFTQRQPERRLAEDVARRLYRQVVEGIVYCHERLVVHRDLKLENLLLEREQQCVKIIDFGFAAQVASRETKLRAFCGTPSYMAPEIIRGEGYSGFATDVWALGVVIFALLSGVLPFSARTEMQLYAKIRRASFTMPDLLTELQRRLIKGAMRFEAAARPACSAILRHPWMTGEQPAVEIGSKSTAESSDAKREPVKQESTLASGYPGVKGARPAPRLAAQVKGHAKPLPAPPAVAAPAKLITAGGGTAFGGS